MFASVSTNDGQVCNFTNAIFFWAFMPETRKRPLEEMNYLFTNAPIFVPFIKSGEFELNDLERRVEEVERKQGVHRTESVS